MNNSDPTLTAAEEKLTAFLDGKLTPAEAAAFEREHPEAAAEKRSHTKLRAMLAKDAPVLRNGDFFNHQILREIGAASEERQPARAKAAVFPLWRLVFAGAACLIAAAGIYFGSVAGGAKSRGDYFAQVLSVKAGDPEISAQVIDADGIAVVWIDGLASLSSEYVLE